MKYLITDPCYLVPGDDWHRVLEQTNYLSTRLPYKVGRSCLIHKAKGTPNVDCGFEEDGRKVCCDAGMFCVAEVNEALAAKQDTPHGKFGKFYPTLDAAFADFDRVIAWADHGGDPTDDDE